MNKNKTAILIFANSAEKDAHLKPFFSKDVFAKLNKQTLKIVQKTDIPYFLFSEKEQTGTTFGERFSNAVESVFKKGFQKVIVVGNDTPHLQAKHLIKTSHKLQQNDIVLGPSKDGGFYLMGIKKEHFNKKTFLELPWQTNKLHSCISSILTSRNLTIDFLEVLNDIDSKSDILFVLNSFRFIPKAILKVLQTYICIQKIFIIEFFFNLKKVFSSPNFNKGSPFILTE